MRKLDLTKRSLYALFISGLICFTNCSDNINQEDGIENEDNKFDLADISDEEVLNAIHLLGEFDKQETATRSMQLGDDLDITSIETSVFSYEIDEKSELRSSSLTSNEEKETFNLYTISFKKNENNGFAIIAGDGRLSQIYAYTDNGNIADTTHNVGLHYVISRIPDVCMYQLDDYYSINEDNIEEIEIGTRSAETVNLGPYIRTNWYQTTPFNDNYPKNSCVPTSNGRYYAGCTPIAIGQAVAYFNPPAARLNGRFDFAALTAYEHPYYTSDMAADFIYYIGSRVLTTMDCNGSGAHLNKCFSLLDEWNLNYYYNEGNVDCTALTSTIYGGGVMVESGTRKTDKAAHSWIVCGMRGEVKNICPTRSCLNSRAPVDKNKMLFYCNWGWGGTDNNGWYNWALIEHPKTQHAAFLADNRELFIRSVKGR